jgi:predicted 3-demethylubiquinone-9 3-methyltransferase (glyoxalase superfamily)
LYSGTGPFLPRAAGYEYVQDQIKEKTMPADIQKITPFLWFDDNAEEAVDFYVSVFRDSAVTNVTRYGPEASKASGRPEGTVMTITFQLEGQEFVALNGGPIFRFTEAVSFAVSCGSQEEIDYYWEKLSAGGDEKAQECGWLKDRYGLSWQITPAVLPELLLDPEKSRKVMKALLQMRKIDIEILKAAAL